MSTTAILTPSPILMSSSSLPRLLHRLPLCPHLRRRLTISAAAVKTTTTWTPAPLSLITPLDAAATLFHVSLDLSNAPALAAAYSTPGQYLQLRLPEAEKPLYLSMASTPPFAAEVGEFQFLVKKVEGTTAGMLCGMERGEVVEVSDVLGSGFQVEELLPPGDVDVVILFANGSGVGPIRALIESGIDANKRSDVRLYFGARNLKQMAYQDRFKEWESAGVRIIPVLSQPDDKWEGETGYVQHAFSRNKQLANPSSTGVVLCGAWQMMKDVTDMLVADGVSQERILKNY